MAPKLCDVCSHVPAWFGSLSWDVPIEDWEDYTSHEPELTLRSWKDMQSEAEKNGCDLCMMITSPSLWTRSPWRLLQVYPNMDLRDAETLLNTPLTFRRSLGLYNTYFTFRCVNDERLFFGSVYPAPSSWCPRFLPLAGYNESNAESNILLMKDWLDHCQQNHTKCKNSSKDFLPTRLLDVEAFKCSEAPNLGDDVQLVCLHSNEIGCEELPSYISLSHCWGPPSKRPATTTKANLSRRMTRISFSDLPKTFQDAVDITRKLGQRYLWIDSLCIIQDSEQDWAREASLMAKVYSYAYCTLAALGSKDGSEGLQQFDIQDGRESFVDITAATTNGDCAANSSSPQSQYRIFLGPPPLEWSRRYAGTTHDSQQDHDNVDVIDMSPLRFRAWTLQEQTLSRRTILFSKTGLLWECGELKGIAQLPWQDKKEGGPFPTISDTGGFYEWAQIRNSPKTRDLAAATLEAYTLEARWWSLVEDYSSRLLTQETDRLIALTGVAQAYKENFFPSSGYAAGLWEEHLPEGLLWRVQHGYKIKTSRPAEYVAPSWSWASVRGHVLYDRETLVDRFKKKMGQQQQQQQQQQPGPLAQEQEQGQRSLPQPLADRIRDKLRVEEMRVQPKYEDVYGALSDALLVLSGARMIEVDPYPDRPEPLDSDIGWGVDLKKNGRVVAKFQPDVFGVLETCGGVLMCLGIRNQRGFEYRGTFTTIPDKMEGILLKEVHEEDGVVTYCRAGYLSWMDVSLFEGVKPRRIILK